MTDNSTNANEAVERKPSAIDFKIKDLIRNTRYFKAVADGTSNKSSPEYQAHAEEMIGMTIGAAIGNGQLYRNKEVPAEPLDPAQQMKHLREDARWLAAAAAQSLGVEKNSTRYVALSETIVDAAITTAIAGGRLTPPQRSFAERVDESRQAPPTEGVSV